MPAYDFGSTQFDDAVRAAGHKAAAETLAAGLALFYVDTDGFTTPEVLPMPHRRYDQPRNQARFYDNSGEPLASSFSWQTPVSLCGRPSRSQDGSSCESADGCCSGWACRIRHSAGLRPKTERFLDILAEDPFRKPPPFEKLLGDLRGAYSRRINIQHRLVYQVMKDERVVKVLRMWTHYE